jgi:hypothetical protein
MTSALSKTRASYLLLSAIASLTDRRSDGVSIAMPTVAGRVSSHTGMCA